MQAKVTILIIEDEKISVILLQQLSKHRDIKRSPQRSAETGFP